MVADTGDDRIRFCSQNLHNLGLKTKKKSRKAHTEQRKLLIERIQQAGCDVVAMQEVVGKDKKSAQLLLSAFANNLSKTTGVEFQAYVGESNSTHIRNGFLIASGIGEVIEEKSFSNVTLASLQPLGPVKRFLRGPYALLIRVPKSGKAAEKKFFVVTMHFKSQSDGYRDITGLSFETLRMEMAETLRRIVEEETAEHNAIAVILGDRNAASGFASADVLSGRRELSDFFHSASCEVPKNRVAMCKNPPRARRFVELLELFGEKTGKSLASYEYRKKQEILDEILVPASQIALFADTRGVPRVGTTGAFYRGSDHRLVWAEANW